MRYSLVFIIILLGCGIDGGTHGSIKGYRYHVSKHRLQEAVNAVINTSQNVVRDTSKDYYNDGENYLTITIKKQDVENIYTFRYYGKKEDWDTSHSSEVFIAYAHDKEGNGGSTGDGGFTRLSEKSKQKLIGIFETEFIDKVDGHVGQTHVTTD
ncbi:hypothetical protein [Flavisolibacter nicotianae]|uniref:hypothetical protein n=1 Tax=Flavisolibacter nicotianae TaxID=2364882 RepID=UPI000EAB8A91|nr:hypothetical protein [Flavisolibacter nicotianae]